MSGGYYAGGLLYHPASGRVLLQQKGDDAPGFPGMWELFGGRWEPGDEGPLATWRRELAEELGVDVPADQIRPLCNYVNEYALHRHIFSCVWPVLQRDFVLREGKSYDWHAIDEALHSLPLSGPARQDLAFFRHWLATR